jgi:uncharacterized protein (TIGR02391 family)
MAWPSRPEDFLVLDPEQQADLLLSGLSKCKENERGSNFIHFRLNEWFSDLTSGVGAPSTFSKLQVQREQAMEALDEAYALLGSRGLIRSDPRWGNSFCQVTAAGKAQVDAGHLPDAGRVTFAGRALAGLTLHPALCKRHVDTHFLQGKFETALRDGSTFLEDSIRTLGGLDVKLVGVKLASMAFSTGSRLTDPNIGVGEQVAAQHLYMGYFGAVRNRVAHRDFRYPSDKEAFQALMLLDYLTQSLDAAARRLGAQLV